MNFNWIKPEEHSINCLLLMDRWIIRHIARYQCPEFKKRLGKVLAYHPAIKWYFENKSPEITSEVEEMVKDIPQGLSPAEIRKAEIDVLYEFETMVVYVYPEIMEECNYIRDWDEDRLLTMVDFTDKVVLDIGSGTGRLAFAAAKKAKYVFASEPVDKLREHMREKIEGDKIDNVFVIDGTVERIPYLDDTFDIVMSAHVIGDDYEKEYNEMKRVVKSGGYIIDCPGEDDRKKAGPSQELLKLGFSYSHYVSISGGDVYRYWRQVTK